MLMKKYALQAKRIFPFLLSFLVLLACMPPISASEAAPNSSKFNPIPVYSYKIVNTFPHDSSAFTQGLVYDDGELYEGTGQYGRSTLRRVDLETGSVLKQIGLDNNLFGEGVAIFKDRLIQLTWQSGRGLVYDKNNLTKMKEFGYLTEGWGLTSDGKRLIMSDGTNKLHFLDAETFAEQRQLSVMANGLPVQGLNELEYINGEIFANMWPTNWIVIISPDSGEVIGTANLQGILDQVDGQGSHDVVDVLNGIAYDASDNRLFVTGKLWPWLFEIELMTEDSRNYLANSQ
jgi:glutaminyl-peptide cyclotransferase